MSQPSEAALPPGYSPPIAVITDHDHGGWIIIANALGLCFTIVSLAMRLFMRTKVSPPIRRDDYSLMLGIAFGVIESSVSFVQVHNGFGRSIELISGADLIEIQKSAFTVDIFYLITIYLSKISTIYLLIRITPDHKQQRVLTGAVAAFLLLMVISIFSVALRCDVSQPWLQYGRTCPGLFARWQAVAAFDIVTEALLFAAPIYLLHGLQMNIARKGKVLVAFSFRLPVIAFCLLRLARLKAQINSDNATLVGAMVGVWTQVEMHYSLAAATIPCMNPFLSALNTDFGAIGTSVVIGNGYGSGHGYGSGSGSRHNASGRHTDRSSTGHALQSMAPPRTIPDDYSTEMKLRPDQSARNVSARVSSGGHKNQADQQSVESTDSTQLIIKKKVDWTVRSETGDDTTKDTDRHRDH